MLEFKTNSILDCLFEIAIGLKDSEIRNRTRDKIEHFPDLAKPGRVIIYFDEDNPNIFRASNGQFQKHSQIALADRIADLVPAPSVKDKEQSK